MVKDPVQYLERIEKGKRQKKRKLEGTGFATERRYEGEASHYAVPEGANDVPSISGMDWDRKMNVG